MSLKSLNEMPPDELQALLRDCCPAPSWGEVLAKRRPYASLGDLFVLAERALASMTAADVALAIDCHPRIGAILSSDTRENIWSRTEQASVSPDSETRAAFSAANDAYEDRFGHVFLICATGLSEVEIMRELRARLLNDHDLEDRVTAEELKKIVMIRLRKAVD